MSSRNLVVYQEDGIYAGWPANHGAWQWGDEFLVGFLRGAFSANRSTHNIKPPFQKVQARSTDGGETWSVEEPNVDFEAVYTTPPPPFSLSGGDIIRCCGTYDHGGEYCAVAGGFYLSRDRGRRWEGAYSFTGLEAFSSDEEAVGGMGTMRTCVLPDRNLVFLSYAKAWFNDYTVVVTHNGSRFIPSPNSVCEDDMRAVMPAVAEVGGRLVVALRRRYISSCWVDAYGSDDNGVTWSKLSEVALTGGHNGNPPALLAVGDRLFCAYGNRTECSIILAESRDRGQRWTYRRLRNGAEPDIGYPRLFLRSDGRLVCVYYWTDNGEPQHIAGTVVEI